MYSSEDMIDWIDRIHNEMNKEYKSVKTLEIAGAIFSEFNIPDEVGNDSFGVTIRRVPKEILGYRILGRAFPWMNMVEISDELSGNDFEEVKLHELLHIQDPHASEYNIRLRTKDILGKTRFQ